MRTTALMALAAGLASLGTACGLDPNKIPTHEIYADDGERIDTKGEIRFAIVGSTASMISVGDVAPEVVADVGAEIPVRDLQFVFLTGNYVRRSTTSDWQAFAARWAEVLRGSTISDNKGRKKVEPMPGSNELTGDAAYKGFGAAFPGVGAEIGLNRVGTWYHFDVAVDRDVWRFVVLDTHKAALGSRWQEQLFWLPKVVSGDAFDHLVVFTPDPLVTLADGATMNPDGATRELLDVIEDNSGIMKLSAVISGGAATNEVFLPSGAFGELVVVAGNAGVAAQDLKRWGPADAAGLKDVQLEPMFDLALMNEFDRWSSALSFDEKTIDMAKARGTFETYTGVYDGAKFPVRGWWVATLRRDAMTLRFRMRDHDGSFRDVYEVVWDDDKGWVGDADPE